MKWVCYHDQSGRMLKGWHTIQGVAQRFDSVSGTYVFRGDLSPSEVYDVLWLVNQVRASAGVAPLVWDEDLASSAELRAAELTIQLSHFRPDGTPCSAVFPESDSWEHACAENIAMGQRPAYEAYQSWTNSPGHYRNMVNPDYRKLGVGCFVDQ